ncbi:MAG TPA: phasin family protein [Luteimonas sp.]|nr:phasin family protein [Luteimonas sp.]
MARFKQSSKRSSSTARPEAQAERLSKSISESAQQIWLAGVGAFGRAQAEGTRLFDTLVKEGVGLEQTARRFGGERAEQVRETVEAGVGQARERAADTWDRLEKVFETRVQKALVGLGVPARDDLRELSERVDRLTAELQRQRGGAAKSGAAGKATKKATGKTTKKTAKAPSKSAAARKAPPGRSAKKAASKKTAAAQG